MVRLVSQDSFFSEAAEAFGGVAALPAHASAATMEQVAMHLQEETDDGSIDGLGELLQQASGQPEPTIQGIVQSLLKFQGIKVTENGAGAAHGHGHVSVDMTDLSECTSRVQAAVSACLKRVGLEAPSPGVDAQAELSTPLSSTPRSTALSRLGSRLTSTLSPRERATGAGEASLGVQLIAGSDGDGGVSGLHQGLMPEPEPEPEGGEGVVGIAGHDGLYLASD